jgi:hypothetical protein
MYLRETCGYDAHQNKKINRAMWGGEWRHRPGSIGVFLFWIG